MDSNKGSPKVQVKKSVKNRLISSFFSHSKEITSAVIVGVLITIFSSAILDYIFPDSEWQEPNEHISLQPQQTNVEPSYRGYFIRANLANVLAIITPLKTQISMHFQMMGAFPTEIDDIDIDSFDLEEHELINSSFMTEKGGVGVYLSKEFGDNKYLVIEPSSSKNGAFIKWNCFTNIDKKHLGLPKQRLCDFQQDL